MTGKSLTLADLLLSDAASVENHLQESEQVSGLSEELRVLPNIPFEKILPDLMDELKKVLDVSLKDILLGSLKQLEELRKTIEKSRQKPEEVIIMNLVDTKITSTHHPFIDVFLGERQVSHIVINATLTLTLKGVAVKLQAGEIRQIKSGTCDGEGKLKIDDLTLASRKLIRLDLPGLMEFARATDTTEGLSEAAESHQDSGPAMGTTDQATHGR